MTRAGELFEILKGVSRSFYLSVRFLPEKIRLTIALGYLLARASDTIADTNGLPAQARIEFLSQFLNQLGEPDSPLPLAVTPFLGGQPEGPEKVLLLNV